MLTLTILSGARAGEQLRLDGPVVTLGRSERCQVRLDGFETVSGHHAQLVLEDGAWLLLDTGSTNGTSVNGAPARRQMLAAGDVVRLGGDEGISLRIDALALPAGGGPVPTPDPRSATRTVATPPPEAAGSMAEAVAQAVGRRADTTAALVAGEAAARVAEERARAGGKSSGQTLHIMAEAVAEVHQSTRARAGQRWRKVVAAVGAVGLLVAAGMGLVIWRQRQQIEALVSKKSAIDQEIAQVMRAMEAEGDEARLAELEQRLAQLTGTAQVTIGQVAEADQERAAALAAGDDQLDRDIRRILAKFDAQTYAVPPLFKETLQREVDTLARAGNLKYVWARRNRHWPAITEAFSALGLPEEMAYVAWAETQFDPEKVSPAGARGMWQMTAPTARELGLKVEEGTDERLDVAKQTRAAARKLADLLTVFGSDSFMLAMASYNSGEAGVRRVLLQVGREKDGFRKEKRDFWHLYRTKRLPRETMEYVPRVLAAAVVGGDPARFGLEAPAPSAAPAAAPR